MFFFNRLTAVLMVAALIGPVAPLEAKSKKGDKYLSQGRALELKKQWDAALQLYEQALSEDPSDVVYQMAAEKVRFQAAQAHIDKGLDTRSKGLLGEALVEFQKAFAINPGSAAAEQEIRRTQDMIERERRRVIETGRDSSAAERGLTPSETIEKATQERIASILPVPDLRPLNQQPINLKMNNQAPRVLYETLGKLAGINVLFDPEYQPGKNQSVEFNGSTLDEALDYVSLLTKSFWKALSPNTLFVTNDNTTKRRDYEEQVMKVFYLSNVNTPQELQEIVTAVRSVADIQRLFVYNAQNAIIARAEADRIALAEKIINDLDKPKSEVVVDILVMEASSVYTRKITAAIASTGLNVPVNFTPRSGLQVVTNPSTAASTSTSSVATTATPTTATSSGSTSGAIPLANLGHLASSDFSIILPNAQLQLLLSDAATKILQSPQLRSVDSQKASLKIGDRQPTATGSFQPGIGGVGINPLVNTQFTYIDVGVNVDLTPRVHDNGEISMHVELDVSNVNGSVNLGGIDQPIIGQRKIVHDIRMRDGEVNLLGGLVNQQDTKKVSGIPGLSSIPILRRLFTGEEVDRNRSELMIALVPHIIRRPELTPENLLGIAVGNATVVKLNYAPLKPAAPAAGPAAPVAPAPAAPPATAPVAPPAVAPRPAAVSEPAVTAPPSAPPAMVPNPGNPPATAPPLPPPAPSAPERPAGNAFITFAPAQIDANVASVITVALVLENGADVTATPFQIQFDPKVVRINDVIQGTYFAVDGRQPVLTKSILNDSGSATVQLSLPPGSPGVSGTGSLVKLSIQTLARGSTTITVPNLTVRNSQGAVVASASPRLDVNVK